MSHFQAHFEFISGMLAGIALTFLVILFYTLVLNAAKAEKKWEKDFDKDFPHNSRKL